MITLFCKEYKIFLDNQKFENIMGCEIEQKLLHRTGHGFLQMVFSESFWPVRRNSTCEKLSPASSQSETTNIDFHT